MAKAATRAFIDVPGFGRLESEKGATFNLGGFNRDPIITDGGVAGFDEEVVAPTLSCTVVKKKGLSVAKLNSITDATVTVTLSDGSVYVMEQAWTTTAGEISNGRYSLAMSAIRAEEVN